MPVVRNIKYKKLRPLLTGDELGAFARTLKAKRCALHVNLTGAQSTDLAVLGHFAGIKHIAIHGATAADRLDLIPHSIVDLCLLNANLKDYEEISHLKKLRILDHRGGCVSSAAGIARLPQLTAVQFVDVRGLHDLNPIRDSLDLQWLKLSGGNDIKGFPDLSNLVNLKRVIIEQCNGSIDLSNLNTAPSLDELIVIESERLEPSDFEPLAKSKTPRRILPGIGKLNSNKFAEVCRLLGQKVTMSYYGTPSEFVEITYGDGIRLRAS